MKSATTLYMFILFVSIHYTIVSNAQLGIQDIKICVFSDPHYFDTSLLINDGPSFQEYLNNDRKLLVQLMDQILYDSSGNWI